MAALHPDALDLEVVLRSTDRLIAALETAGPTTPVPTCGDWTLADLIWHVVEVQKFWCHVIGNRPSGPDSYDRPQRVGDDQLAQGLRRTTYELVEHLGAADPADRAWSWAEEQTVAFTVRRQIHEALVHSIDGDLAVGRGLPAVEPALAADGIDEMVNVMITGTRERASFQSSGHVTEIVAVDTADRWVLVAGSVMGTPRGTERQRALDGYELGPDREPDATIEGSALDVLLWMWGRREMPLLRRPADVSAAHALRRVVVQLT